jgi:sarcosine oxidase gamma subunit
VTQLEFLSARPAATAEFRPQLRSPLERALAHVPRTVELRDLSLELAKFEVRGELDAVEGDLIRITPTRGLVLAPYADGETVETRLRRQAATVIDVTGALAALRVAGPLAPTLMRRLTDLDLDVLPAAGAVVHVPAIVRGGGELFDLFWPQEYGHYLAHVVVDAAEGLS